MNRRIPQVLTAAAEGPGAAVLRAFFSVAFLAPGWARTPGSTPGRPSDRFP